MQLNSLTLSDCGDRYPNGIYVSSLGCYYFVDYDGDLGYFIGLEDGSFEDETHYVDFDTMSDEDAANIRKIQEKIAANSWLAGKKWLNYHLRPLEEPVRAYYLLLVYSDVSNT